MTSLGLPVELGSIEKELGRLWESSGEKKTRASLINLAIYTEEKESIDQNTALIREIAGRHPLRALLIIAENQSPTSHLPPLTTIRPAGRIVSNQAQAWITAHCYMHGKQGEEVCSEQITFLLSHQATENLPGIVFSHCDSDLPLVFWRQGEFSLSVDEEFWSFVDRLIFDSHDWTHLNEQFVLVNKIAELSEHTSSKTELCDLNWMRIFSLRKTLAAMFDCSVATPELWKINNVTLEYGTHYYSTALLLLGWLVSQLCWKVITPGVNAFFQDANGNNVKVALKEVEGCGISRVHLQSQDAEFLIQRSPQSQYFHTEMRGSSISEVIKAVRIPRDRLEDILLAELARSGRHPLYTKAVKAIELF